VLIGCVVVLAGFAQPLVLLVISACVGGGMMVLYSALLIVLNRKVLPKQIAISNGRLAALAWAFLLFGVLSILTVIDQVGKLLGAEWGRGASQALWSTAGRDGRAHGRGSRHIGQNGGPFGRRRSSLTVKPCRS
jgi:hypothetical protein